MKVIVFGANGQLGSDIAEVLKANYEVIGMTHEAIDISDLTTLENYLSKVKAYAVINTTAYHNVELCEQNPETAFKINSESPALMAKICKQIGAKFIHISTDYVFDGKKGLPYLESDMADPLNVYGKTKLKGEKEILLNYPEAMVLRVSGLYGTHPCRAKNGLNFVQLMLKLAREKGEVKVVNDEFVSPTYTLNVAEQIKRLLKSDLSGIIHATSDGSCSWYDFANEIFRYTHTKVKLDPASSNDFPAKVPRPKYSVLENKKLKDANLDMMPDWKKALHQYLNTLNQPA